MTRSSLRFSKESLAAVWKMERGSGEEGRASSLRDRGMGLVPSRKEAMMEKKEQIQERTDPMRGVNRNKGECQRSHLSYFDLREGTEAKKQL